MIRITIVYLHQEDKGKDKDKEYESFRVDAEIFVPLDRTYIFFLTVVVVLLLLLIPVRWNHHPCHHRRCRLYRYRHHQENVDEEEE